MYLLLVQKVVCYCQQKMVFGCAGISSKTAKAYSWLYSVCQESDHEPQVLGQLRAHHQQGSATFKRKNAPTSTNPPTPLCLRGFTLRYMLDLVFTINEQSMNRRAHFCLIFRTLSSPAPPLYGHVRKLKPQAFLFTFVLTRPSICSPTFPSATAPSENSSSSRR